MRNKLNMAAIRLKAFVDSFIYQEKGAVDVVAIVILIAVAVALAIVFKDQITNIVNTLLDGISDKAATAIE